tara:strand:+ start:754 stop:1158 length:405 start_codon:yes stop_codon:yes gene_type:complete
MEFTVKDENKLNELLSKSALTGKGLKLRNELEYKRNKQNVLMQLPRDDKYYYAWQCYELINYIKEKGVNNYISDEIKDVTISYGVYGGKISLHLASSGVSDYKTFNEKRELLGFIVGFNEAIIQSNNVWNLIKK